MKIKEVSPGKFDELIRKGVKLKNCPQCHSYGGEIIIDMPLYGKYEGVRARCHQCGYETRTYSSSISIMDGAGRIGNPRTPKGILNGILSAVNEYNKKSINKETKEKEQ